jgi:hypothetical protein
MHCSYAFRNALILVVGIHYYTILVLIQRPFFPHCTIAGYYVPHRSGLLLKEKGGIDFYGDIHGSLQ